MMVCIVNVDGDSKEEVTMEQERSTNQSEGVDGLCVGSFENRLRELSDVEDHGPRL